MQRYRNHIYYPAQAPIFHLKFDNSLALQSWLEQNWPWQLSDHSVLHFPLVLRNRIATDLFGGVSLKKWFQSRGVPPWLREAWPVVENEQGCYLLGVN
jgi:tRNA(Ile)-lysidine synthase